MREKAFAELSSSYPKYGSRENNVVEGDRVLCKFLCVFFCYWIYGVFYGMGCTRVVCYWNHRLSLAHFAGENWLKRTLVWSGAFVELNRTRSSEWSLQLKKLLSVGCKEIHKPSVLIPNSMSIGLWWVQWVVLHYQSPGHHQVAAAALLFKWRRLNHAAERPRN